MKPATERQLARMVELNIQFVPGITMEEAAELLRLELPIGERKVDMQNIKSAMAVESEGDPKGGRQWED